MTQVHLAQAAGVSLKTIVRLEAGARISFDTQRALRAVLDIPYAVHPVDESCLPAAEHESEGQSILGSSEEGAAGDNHAPLRLRPLGMVIAAGMGVLLAVGMFLILRSSEVVSRSPQDGLARTNPTYAQLLRLPATTDAVVNWRTVVMIAGHLVSDAPPVLSRTEIWNGHARQSLPLDMISGWPDRATVDGLSHLVMRGGRGLMPLHDEPMSVSTGDALSRADDTAQTIRNYQGALYTTQMWSGADARGTGWVRVAMSPIPQDVCERMISSIRFASLGKLELSAVSVGAHADAAKVPIPRNEDWVSPDRATCVQGWNGLLARVSPVHSEVE